VTRLYARIFLAFWATMVLVVAGAVGVTWLVLVERGEEIPRASADLVRGAALALRDGGEEGLRAWLRSVRPSRPEMRLLVVDGSGRELLGRPLPPGFGRLLRAPRGELPDLPGLEVLPARPLPQLVAPDGRRYGVLVLPPRNSYGLLGVPETRWAVLLLALAVTGVASLMLARSITRPVSALGTATRDLAAGNLDARVGSNVSGRGDELGTLARDFDAMAGRLKELLRARQQLLRDVSHELRSPLARMRVALGLVRQPGSDVGRQLDRLETEIERLDRLIGQVLHLSRLDAHTGALPNDDIDLFELVDGIARDAAFEAQARNVGIDWHPPHEQLHARGDAALLASAVENVVRNAVRYTAPGTRVRITLERDGGSATITARDAGPGVPDSELQRIFEPFHRVAESRTRDSGGDGIGLAITARVLAAHGGTARASNAIGGGLAVTLSLPLPAGPAASA
jgi:two-component system OmpR family sensor kinase